MRARPKSSLVLGLLGGVASGKSTVAGLLAGKDGVVISADRLAQGVLASPAVIAQIAARFGASILTAEGQIDRPALAALIFAEKGARTALEEITHPPIRAAIRGELDRAKARAIPRIVLDIPLLLENDAAHQLVAECDHLICIEVPEEVREARAQRDRGWAPGEVARREAAQLPLSLKRAAAGFALDADCPREALDERVQGLLRAIEAAPPHHEHP